MLLDHPNNYENNEMIPCLTFDLKFPVIPAIEVQEYFQETPSTETTYALLGIDSPNCAMSDQIFDQNKQPLSDRFAMRNREAWLQFLTAFYHTNDENK